MANISKEKRDKMLKYIESLKSIHNDDESIKMFNEIEDSLNEKKFGLVFEEHTEEVDELLKNNIPVFVEDKERVLIKDETKPLNFIIEGDNLQALYLLEKTHRGKVDCIYIDPPYNTGARDWKYNNDYVDSNDTYRHSKWLSMMRSRLVVAKRLLSKDGALVCAIDENELNTLGLLLREIFDNYAIDCIAVVHNPGGIQGTNFSYCHEYAYFVYPNRSYYIQKEKRNNGDLTPFRDWGKENSKREGSPNCFYPIFVDLSTNAVVGTGPVPNNEFHPTSSNEIHDNIMWVWPIDINGVERRWRFAYDTVSTILDELVAVKIKGITNIQRKKQYYTRKTLWNDPSFSANNSGTQILTKFVGNRFSFPKSLYLVKECIKACEQKKDSIILDFFAGSGTTLHAVNLLNKEDGGNRKCIMVTNNEVSLEEAKQLTKDGFLRGSKEWEQYGIAQYVTWPRTINSINGVDVNGNAVNGYYLTLENKTIPIGEGFVCNVKYLKCDWIPRHPEDYLLSNALMLHIKEMVELQNAIEIDNVKNVLLINKDDVKNYILNPEHYSKIENVWLNQNLILNASEVKLLKQKGFRYIPREFFGEELKEANE